MPDLSWNKKVWDKSYGWPAHGDEWTQFAEACGVPYEKWKDSLARTFLIPNLKPDSSVIEIGPGHGRWTEIIAPRSKELFVVDISESCIEFCKKRFSKYSHISYGLNGTTGTGGELAGAQLACAMKMWHKNAEGLILGGHHYPPDQDGGNWSFSFKAAKNYCDFIWSFDTFVHIEEPEIRAYAREFHRVMKPQSMGAIHHTGTPTAEQRQNGARSQVGLRQFGAILSEAGLHVIRQTDEWNGGNLKMSGDVITVFARP